MSSELEKQLAQALKRCQQLETQLEQNTLELGKAKLAQEKLADSLEAQVQARTQELEETRDEALASAKTKSLFLANMSHEIRTPMNGVLGMLRALQNCQDETKSKKLINTAMESGELLVSIINNILEFSKLDSIELELENAEFNLYTSLEDVVHSFASNAHVKGLDIISALDPNLPMRVKGDVTRIKQVVGNLINNAIKFTEQGEVTIGAQLNDDKSIRIFVNDTGIGLNEQQQQRIFKAFGQADSSTTRQYGGTGLGLSISAKLVRQFGSRIEIKSQPKQGSTFYFDLPIEFIDKTSFCSLYGKYLHKSIIVFVSLSVGRRAFYQRCFTMLGCQDFMVLNSLAELKLRPGLVAHHHLILLDHDDMTALDKCLAELNNIKLTNINVVNISRYQDNEQSDKRQLKHLCKPVCHNELYQCLTGKQIEFKEQEKLHYSFIGKRLLVIDDNYVNLQVAKELFESVGFQVEIGISGLDALEMVQHLDVDVVMMDIQMPHMDGLSAAKAIRALGSEYQQLPIVAMTAHVMQEDRKKSFDAGMNAHLTKPIEPDKAMSELAQLLKVEAIEHSEHDHSHNESTSLPELDGFNLEDAVKRLRGNWDRLKKLLISFINNNTDADERMQTFLEQAQWEDAERLAHQLKGSGANLGADTLSLCAGHIEQDLKDKNPEAAKQRLDTFREEILKLKQAQTILLYDSMNETQAPSCPLNDNSGPMIRLLEDIEKHLQFDLAKAMSGIETLVGQCKNTPYQGFTEELSRAFDNFDNDKVLQLIKEKRAQLQ
ncbi:ATP-binding protein [Agaribacterium sp. ZY112]|uniref:ATP-binding protein n=1 Tax=Agaribacterium sp. ZY112 TaxID=3233574 RepID=UPI003525A162